MKNVVVLDIRSAAHLELNFNQTRHAFFSMSLMFQVCAEAFACDCMPHMMKPAYEVKFLRYRVRHDFFVILDYFSPFHHPTPNKAQNQSFKKMRKASGDVITLNLCNKKHDHMYAYSDIECDRHNFLSFQAICCPFTPLLTPKIKIWKKSKTHLDILSFYTSVP